MGARTPMEILSRLSVGWCSTTEAIQVGVAVERLLNAAKAEINDHHSPETLSELKAAVAAMEAAL